MKFDSFDSLSTKEYRRMCADYGNWHRFCGAAKVAEGNGYAHLMSYETPIASFYDYGYKPQYDDVDNGHVSSPFVCDMPTLWLKHDACEYSRATCRHLSLFLSRYVIGVNYHDVKAFLKDAAIGQFEIRNHVFGLYLKCIDGIPAIMSMV